MQERQFLLHQSGITIYFALSLPGKCNGITCEVTEWEKRVNTAKILAGI